MPSDKNRTQSLFDKLQRFCRLSTGAKAEAVHQLRTTIRRIETLLATASPTPARKERKFLKQLKRLRRRAGKVRDLDVQMEALGSLRLESSTRDRARVMAFLEKARARREKKLLGALQAEVENGLTKRSKLISAHLLQESPKPHPRLVEDRFLAAALDKFAAVAGQHAALTESNLHDFRMDCKRVRYLAEMGGEGAKVAALIEQLKRVQDAVGTWHDWVTLTATAESVLSRTGQVPLLSALRADTRSKYLEALRIATDAKRILLEMHAARLTARKPVAIAAPPAEAPTASAATA
jgi:CHAD domain-containing protein